MASRRINPGRRNRPTATRRPSTTSVKIDVKSSMLTVHEEGKLIAAYPVTIGSEQTESPVGDWKVRAVAKMPNFRYDKEMLNKGVRSDNFHMLATRTEQSGRRDLDRPQ